MKKTNYFIYVWYIPVFLLGMAVGLVLLYRLTTPEMWWAKNHPEEVRWAKARYDLIQKAAGALYFDDKNEGITIVKPTAVN